MRRIGKLARRTSQMKPTDEIEKPVEPQLPPQTIEQMLNTMLYSIIAKHQREVYAQLMELQKSMQQTTKKEEENENNKKDNS